MGSAGFAKSKRRLESSLGGGMRRELHGDNPLPTTDYLPEGNSLSTGNSSTHVPARHAICQVHHRPGFQMWRGHDQVPVWALPVQRLLSDLLADTEFCDYVAIAIGIMCLQVVQQAAALAHEHQETPA